MESEIKIIYDKEFAQNPHAFLSNFLWFMKKQHPEAIDLNWNKGIHEKAEQAHEFLKSRNLIWPRYPITWNMDDLDRLIELHDIISSFTRSFDELLYDETIPKSLSLSTSSTCNTWCLHCQVNATKKWNNLDYSLLEKMDNKFFQLFDKARLSFDWNPLAVKSKNSQWRNVDLSDYIRFLFDKWITKFNLDLKTLDDEQIKTYRKIQQFFNLNQSANFEQRISFNLFSPEAYKASDEDRIEILKKEFLPILHKSGEFADKIYLLVTWSMKYDNANIYKTFSFLNYIMECEWYHPVRDFFHRYFFVEDLFTSNEEYEKFMAMFDKDKNSLFNNLASHVSNPNKFELMKKCFLLNEPYKIIKWKDKFFQNNALWTDKTLKHLWWNIFNTPIEQYEEIPSHYYNIKTWRKIEFWLSGTKNLWRWGKKRNKWNIFQDNPNESRIEPLCIMYQPSNVHIWANWQISGCSWNYRNDVQFAHVDDWHEDILRKWKMLHNHSIEYLRKNIYAIANWEKTSWVCTQKS